MNGREVFRHAVQKISGVIEETLVDTGYAADEIDLYVPHQANQRILDGIAKKLGVDPAKIVVTLDKHGNTSAASIPLALNQAFEDHRLKEGSLVLMEAMLHQARQMGMLWRTDEDDLASACHYALKTVAQQAPLT